MSKKFRSQASSARAASSTFGNPAGGFGGIGAQSTFATSSSSLSYVAELPDLSQISDPQIVVAFKNLFKKDSVTKAKAIEDLQEQLASVQIQDNGVEEGVLEAWVNIYPRTSIDNSRRVRQLAHTFQGFLATSSGKRIARHLPRVIGAWLAGLYDTDKLVYRAAQEAFNQVFSTEEKRRGVWKVYQAPILTYAEDAILLQTPQTLSDERTVTPDDAEAKHIRAVGTAISVVSQLLAEASAKDIDKDKIPIASLVQSKRLWDFAAHTDPSVRRAVYGLLNTCVSNLSDVLDWTLISNCLIGKALHASQLGSSRELSEALLVATEKEPKIWTTYYTAKTKATKRFHQFLSKGSQRGSDQFWPNIAQLLRKIPAEFWVGDSQPPDNAGQISYDPALQLLDALHDGVINNDEPRQNLNQAWDAYITTCFWLSGRLHEQANADRIITERLLPMVEQYVLSSSEQTRWSIRSQAASAFCTKCLSKLVKDESALVSPFWASMAAKLTSQMKLSSPEQSQSYTSSQDAIAVAGTRYLTLEAQFLGGEPADDRAAALRSSIEDSTSDLLRSAIALIQHRGGKPYGATGIIAASVQVTPSVVFGSSMVTVMQGFLARDIPNLLDTPSADLSISILFSCRGKPGYEEGLTSTVSAVMRKSTSERGSNLMQTLLRGVNADEFNKYTDLKRKVTVDLERAIDGEQTAWLSVESMVKNKDIAPVAAAAALETLLASLSIDNKQPGALTGLALLSDQDKAIMKAYMASNDGSHLLSRLLYLSESPNDDLAHQAESLAGKMRSLLEEDGTGAVTRSNVELVHQNLTNVDAESLSMHTIVALALDILRYESTPGFSNPAAETFPTTEQWQKAIEPFYNANVPLSTAITSVLGGTVYLVDRSTPGKVNHIARDAEGFPGAIRLAFLVTKILTNDPSVLQRITDDRAAAVFYYLPQALQLIDDSLSIPGFVPLWSIDTTDVEDEMVDLLFEGRHLIHSLVQSSTSSTQREDAGTDILATWFPQASHELTRSITHYQHARTFVEIFTEAFETANTFKPPSTWFEAVQGIRSSQDTFRSASLLVLLRDSLIVAPLGKKLCNELISDATDADYQTQPDVSLRKIALLNLLLQGEDSIASNASTQRLVFLVKHLASSLRSKNASLPVLSEILKLLCAVLPPIREIYGSHWRDILEFLAEFLGQQVISEESLPALHSSLRLYARMKALFRGDSNDDLEDAWSANLPALSRGLLEALKQFGDASRSAHQPRAIVTDLLARLVRGLSLVDVVDEIEFYPLLFAEQMAIQGAAYDILHRFVPAKQEQISLDAALSKTDAHLPEELLSLLLNAPPIELFTANTSTIQIKDSHWLGLRRYLLSWKVIFDHFTNASYKVRADYVNDIRDSAHLPSLLDFLVEFLRIPSSKPVDASKFDINSFELATDLSSESEAQWLLAHLYYLCLRHIPSLTKTWWLDAKKRVKAPVEAWTQRFVSPLVTASALDTVSEWTKTLDPSDERPTQVKISPKASELVASIAVDEESPPISLAINLPGAYPLQPALVTSRHRVAVDEKKWRSWLLTIQGIIMFSNGSLIDGLVAFRKNVQGALKGQSECAICYSIISADMQTPNKRCGTCKQTFHSSCLFRWFKSSNSSSCPLCRNNFNYA